jgi:hypothetical protein
MKAKLYILSLAAVMFCSSCDTDIKDSQQIAERFFGDLNAGKKKNVAAYYEHFEFLSKAKPETEAECNIGGVDGYKQFQERWSKLQFEKVEIGKVKMLDNIGLRNEVEVVAHAKGKTYSSMVHFDVKINEVGFGPRGWVVTMTAFPSLTTTASESIGKAICEKN